jgi:hypothetical protein
MGIEKDKKSTEANTTLKDSKRRSLNYKKRGDSVNSIEDIPERMSREPDMSPLKLREMRSGGRVNLRGGGMCKRGMNKKAYGRNS